ncbi:hydroxypyruvate isomerase family protein [Rhodospirillales bacterium]|nr:hydroxypyruvate isomerase family protein [Rhodospirillales bacterium]
MPYFAANLTMMFTEVAFLDRFKAAKDAGFEAVEFLFPYAHPADIVAGKLNENDLTQALFNAPPGDWDAGERGIAALPGREDEFRASIATAIEYALALDCRTVHVMAGLVPDPAMHAEMMTTYIENISYAADQFLPHGITVALEPLNSRDVPGYLISKIGDAAEVFELAGRPNIGIQFDFYHTQIMEGDLAKRFEAHQAQIAHVQVSGVPERHEPSIGEVNYAYLFQLIDRLGYDGFVGCEYNPRGDTVDGLAWLFD